MGWEEIGRKIIFSLSVGEVAGVRDNCGGGLLVSSRGDPFFRYADACISYSRQLGRPFRLICHCEPFGKNSQNPSIRPSVAGQALRYDAAASQLLRTGVVGGLMWQLPDYVNHQPRD